MKHLPTILGLLMAFICSPLFADDEQVLCTSNAFTKGMVIGSIDFDTTSPEVGKTGCTMRAIVKTGTKKDKSIPDTFLLHFSRHTDYSDFHQDATFGVCEYRNMITVMNQANNTAEPGSFICAITATN